VVSSIEVEKDPFQWFWIRRKMEARNFGWFAHIASLVYSVFQLKNPRAQNKVIMMSFYAAIVVLSTVSILMSYKKGRENFVLFGLVLLSFKSGIRLIDFENTKPCLDEFTDLEIV
jgi:hypothetical protein